MKQTSLLLQLLIADSDQHKNISIPPTETEQEQLIRSLMNIRMPRTASEELLSVQNNYLQEALAYRGIVTLQDIPTIREQYGWKASSENATSFLADKLSLWQGDITRLKTGAIVNAANSQMLGCFVPCHRCIDNAIHSAAGIQLRAECDHIMTERRFRYGRQYEEPTGTAILTNAYNLPCDHVIHTVGPIVLNGLTDALRQDLRSCYESVLNCCLEHGITSVAFCCISTGEFHFPNDEAAAIALETVTDFLAVHRDSMERIIFNVFKNEDREIYEERIKIII